MVRFTTGVYCYAQKHVIEALKGFSKGFLRTKSVRKKNLEKP